MKIKILKRSMAIGALILSGTAVSQVRANQIIFLFNGSNGVLGTTATFTDSGTGLQISAAGYKCVAALGGLCANQLTTNYSTDPTAMYQNTVGAASTDGLGINNNPQTIGGITRQEIPNWAFIEFNFSSILAGNTIQDIQFKMTDVITAWSVYKTSTPGVLDSSGGADVYNNQSDTNLHTVSNPGTYISFIAGTNCDTVLNELIVDYTPSGSGTQGTAPEPATLAMTGLALLGLGAILKKTRKQA